MPKTLVRLLPIVFLFLLFSCGSSTDIPDEVAVAMETLPSEIDYNEHVKPILSDRCFKCHGPDKNKIEGDLQLATFEGATFKNKRNRRGIDPGDIDNSELVKRILSHDPEDMMPTPKSNLSLNSIEKATLIKWIDQGAEYKEHWSLTQIEKPNVPKVGKSFWTRWGIGSDEETDWVNNEIDHFTLTKMKEKGLKPKPKAEKTTLLRRLYMDLTGLPPTPAQIEAFLNDNSENAYEKVVNQLMASPHFGEQQAVSWLDLARYADSHGYQDDGMRTAYPYRDWVIGAFNKNLSFDKFITYQLAGDLLPKPTKETLIATAFNRMHPQTQEGGVIEEEVKVEYVADRANTVGKSFLGLTMECARCHDHKYDPISQKDYYSMFAFFDQNNEVGQIPYRGEAAPTLMLPTKDQTQKLNELKKFIKKMEPGLQMENFKSEFGDWLKNGANMKDYDKQLLVHLPFEEALNKKNQSKNIAKPIYIAQKYGDVERQPKITSGAIGNAVQFQGDCGIEIITENLDRTKEGFYGPDDLRHRKGLNFDRNHPFSVNVWVNPLKENIPGTIWGRHNNDDEGYRGFRMYYNKNRTLQVLFSYTYPTNCIELLSTHALKLNQWQNIGLSYDGSGKASGIKIYLDGKVIPMQVKMDNLTKNILHDGTKVNAFSFRTWILGDDEGQKDIDNFRIDEFKIFERQLADIEMKMAMNNKDEITSLLAKTNKTAQEDQQLLEFYTLAISPTFKNKAAQIFKVREQELDVLNDVAEVMIMQELPTEKRRKTHLLNRGVYDAPGAKVTAQTPLKIGALTASQPQNRLGLAQWLLDEKNPLFARVMVNRFWMNVFGNGIVKTQEDFGNQGELPSNQALLDYLAVDFRENNWDVKALVKKMVMSATYQQSSIATKEEIEADPDNKWLARGSSSRYSAEQVRDNALAASGLLVKQIGGPSVYPYQPEGIWEALATRNVVSYKQNHGDSLYRRSMYTIWKRSSPPPMMLNFDSPDRSLCTVRRQKTASPLQALVTLNDPQFIEAARVLSERTIAKKQTLESQIEHIFLCSISRKPRAKELSLMIELYQIELNEFIKNEQKVNEILSTGEYPIKNTQLVKSQLAAMTVVANTILNYDEAIVKR